MFSPNSTLASSLNAVELGAAVGGVVQVPELMYVVMLVVTGRSSSSFLAPCAGTLIRKDLVLTVSACVKKGREIVPDDKIKVILRNAQVLSVKKKYFFPNKGYATYSLALVLVGDTGVRSFPSLPKIIFDSPSTCIISGFGNDNETVSIGDFSYININKTQMTICNQPTSRRDRICVHWLDAIACRGDVGSPLICEDDIVGVYNPEPMTQTIRPCYDRYAAMYSPVFPVVGWIKDIINSIDSFNMAWINSPWSILGISAAALAIIGILYYTVIHCIETRASLAGAFLHDDESHPSIDVDRLSQK